MGPAEEGRPASRRCSAMAVLGSNAKGPHHTSKRISLNERPSHGRSPNERPGRAECHPRGHRQSPSGPHLPSGPFHPRANHRPLEGIGDIPGNPHPARTGPPSLVPFPAGRRGVLDHAGRPCIPQPAWHRTGAKTNGHRRGGLGRPTHRTRRRSRPFADPLYSPSRAGSPPKATQANGLGSHPPNTGKVHRGRPGPSQANANHLWLRLRSPSPSLGRSIHRNKRPHDHHVRPASKKWPPRQVNPKSPKIKVISNNPAPIGPRSPLSSLSPLEPAKGKHRFGRKRVCLSAAGTARKRTNVR